MTTASKKCRKSIIASMIGAIFTDQKNNYHFIYLKDSCKKSAILDCRYVAESYRFPGPGPIQRISSRPK